MALNTNQFEMELKINTPKLNNKQKPDICKYRVPKN